MDRVKGADRETWKTFRNTLSKHGLELSRKFTEKRAAIIVKCYREMK